MSSLLSQSHSLPVAFDPLPSSDSELSRSSSSSKERFELDPDLKNMLMNAPCDVMIVDEPVDNSCCGDDGIPELPANYERSSSVSCTGDADALFATLYDALVRLRCDFNAADKTKITGTAYYHSANVDFNVNTYRNPENNSSSLTVEVHRLSGRTAEFTRFFDEMVQQLAEADVLCGCPTQYPRGQFMGGAGTMVIDELAIPGSSVSSSQRSVPSSSAAPRSGDDDSMEAEIPFPPTLSRGVSLPGPTPPIPSFAPRRETFSAFVPPRRAMDLTLSKQLLENLLAPFRSDSTLEEQRAAAITFARACDNKESRSCLLEPGTLQVLETLVGASDRELVRCGFVVLCRLFEWPDLSRDMVVLLWDRFHPIVIKRRNRIGSFESPELDRYIARMLAASLTSGMSCAELKTRLSKSEHKEGLNAFLGRMAKHACSQVQSHSRRALGALKAAEAAQSLADCAMCS